MKELELIKEVDTKKSILMAVNEINSLQSEEDKKYVKEILQNLKDTFTNLNIKYIVGEFSGGNDEGGFDNVYFADDKEIEIKISEEDKKDFIKWIDTKNIYNYENKEKNKTSIFYTTSNKRIDVSEELEDILYKAGCLEEYGSFAGEFSVNGTVKLDVFTYKWAMSGNQSNEVYENVSDEGEL